MPFYAWVFEYRDRLLQTGERTETSQTVSKADRRHRKASKFRESPREFFCERIFTSQRSNACFERDGWQRGILVLTLSPRRTLSTLNKARAPRFRLQHLLHTVIRLPTAGGFAGSSLPSTSKRISPHPTLPAPARAAAIRRKASGLCPESASPCRIPGLPACALRHRS